MTILRIPLVGLLIFSTPTIAERRDPIMVPAGVAKKFRAAKNRSRPMSTPAASPMGGASTGSSTGLACNDPSMPKCITFRANGGNEPAKCSADQAMEGYTVGDDQPPGKAKHVFAYTHGFCGPTGDGPMDGDERKWCEKVAGECGMHFSESSADWYGPRGAECLIKHIANDQNTKDGVHFEIDNCTLYKGGSLKCYQDLIAAMKKVNIGSRRIVIKNVTPEEAQQLQSTFIGEDSKLVSNFVIVEEKFNKAAVQQALSGTCASVAQSMKTEDYKVNELHASVGDTTPGANLPENYPQANGTGGTR